MKGLYTLTVVTDFAASHIIPGHPGKCARLHGHNWKVEVAIKARKLNAIGMAIDFADIKQQTKIIIEGLDHYHLNDIPPFDEISPTAENVSAWIFQQLADKLNTDDVSLSSVTLWETDRSRVCYSED